MRRGTNLPAVGGFNQAVILDAIRRSPDGVSRVELQERTGLAYQTVANGAKRLLEDGYIREGAKKGTGPGKPGLLLHVADRGRYAVGIHIDPAVTTCVLIDLSGSIIAREQTRTPEPIRPEEVIGALAASVDRLVAEAGVDRSLVLGIGIASPGPIDVDRGVVVDPPLLEGWKEVPLRDALAAATGQPVVLEKDVNAAVVGELWLRRETREDFVFFYLGTGIGMGLALRGELVRGASGNAGEGGTLFVPVSGSVEPGRASMLGWLATPDYILRQAADDGIIPAAPAQQDLSAIEAAFDALLDRERGGERPVRDLFARAADVIATALLSVVNLLDVADIVVGGPYWDRLAPWMEDRIAASLQDSPYRKTRHPVRLRRTVLGEEVAAVGAATLILDNALAPKADSLLIAE
ncbi:ROK family transcriptional regulator [Leifsonia sp. McL0607]|uniref:ROK family transcriptional regulator n=1 Tax=Leifsonia sp. McL0607 TaxID=3415672 RepID=UPI003CEC5ECE